MVARKDGLLTAYAVSQLRSDSEDLLAKSVIFTEQTPNAKVIGVIDEPLQTTNNVIDNIYDNTTIVPSTYQIVTVTSIKPIIDKHAQLIDALIHDKQSAMLFGNDLVTPIGSEYVSIFKPSTRYAIDISSQTAVLTADAQDFKVLNIIVVGSLVKYALVD